MKFSTTTLTLGLLVSLFTLDLSAQISGQVVNFCLNRYNSAPGGIKLPVEDGEILGTIHWRGWTPANAYQTSSAIRSTVAGVPGVGLLPARLDFYNGGSNLWDMRRITILDNGNVGIGFPELTDPVDLFDVNGNARLRGLRLYLGAPGQGGEALTRTDRNCVGGAVTDGLALNYGGGFADGVFVEGPGLHVCGMLEAACLTADENIASRMGNIYTLGGAAVPDPCALPADGDFIAFGNNSDFIARHGNFVADEGNVIATLGNVEAGDEVQAINDVISLTGDVIAGQNVVAQNNVTANFGDVSANLGSVYAGLEVTANGHVTSNAGNISATLGNVFAGQTVTANSHVFSNTGDVIASNGNVIAGASVLAQNDVVANNGDVLAPLGNVLAGQNLIVGVDGTINNNLHVNSRIAIGTVASFPAGYRLYVDDGILAEKVKVAVNGSGDWADYVFEDGYELRPLHEVETFVNENGHLPGVPSADEVVAQGLDVAKMDALLLEKIEELTLYMIDLKKENEALKKEMTELKNCNR